jgi:hypothetical protein
MMRGEKLGKGNRIVIPACVVNKIRNRFPSTDNEYCGFKASIESLQDLFS